MKKSVHFFVAIIVISYFSQSLCMNKLIIKEEPLTDLTHEEIKEIQNVLICECFKAIEEKDLTKIKKMVDRGLSVNSVLDLNKYYEHQKVVGESRCSLLEWARYTSALKIYYFLSQHKDITFECAGFLSLETGSLLPLAQDGTVSKDNKNFYPIQNEKWPTFQPVAIDPHKKYSDEIKQKCYNKN